MAFVAHQNARRARLQPAALDDVLHHARDPLRVAAPEHAAMRSGTSSSQHLAAHRVVEIVVHVRHDVRDAHDPPLERHREQVGVFREDAALSFECLRMLRRASRGKVKPAPVALEDLDHAQRLLGMVEVSLMSRASTDSPACPNGVCPRSWPSAMASVSTSFSALSRAGARNLRDLERVGDAGPVVVASAQKDLRLSRQPPEGFAVQDTIAIELERRSQRIGLLGALPPRDSALRDAAGCCVWASCRSIPRASSWAIPRFS